eukprot:NODE_168_length_14557_cov_0.729008.p2 type:complete len:672 gc:universal NODE_168_length_14557_cov_0.729008:10904-12919(+)
MFTIFSNILPPTSVNCSTFGVFDGKEYLVAAARESVKFYIVQNGKLVVDFKVRIDGVPKSLNVAKLKGRNHLVIQLQTAFSICAVEQKSLKTVSIHDYNREDLFDLGIRHHTQYEHQLLVDQRSSYILMPNLDFFTILPLRDELDDPDKIPYFPSWTVSYRDLFLIDVKNVIFLDGYFEPTIAVLQDGQPYWQGLHQKEQCLITILTLNAQNKTLTQLKSYKGLPSSSQFLLPIPGQTGFIFFCATGFFIFDRSSPSGYGICFNAYHQFDSTRYNEKLESMGLNLDGCNAKFLTNEIFLLILQNGDVWSVKLHSTARSSAPLIDFKDGKPESAVGSRLLMKRIMTISILNDISVSSTHCFLACCGVSKLLNLNFSAPTPVLLDEIDDDDLYKVDTVKAAPLVDSNQPREESIELADSLNSFAPIRCLTTSTLESDSFEGKLILAAATGSFSESRVTFFRQSLPWILKQSYGAKVTKSITYYNGSEIISLYQRELKQYVVEIGEKVVRTEGNPFNIDFKNLGFLQSSKLNLAFNAKTFTIYDKSMELKFSHTHDCAIGTVRIHEYIICNRSKDTLTVFQIDENFKEARQLFKKSDICDYSITHIDGNLRFVVLMLNDMIQLCDTDGDIISQTNFSLLLPIISDSTQSDSRGILTNLGVIRENHTSCHFILVI